MTDAIQVQGWCPSAWQPMRAQDGWMVRVRPHCASISAAQWRLLAQLALSQAHSQIELTRLGNVQLRGVSEPQQVRSQLIAAQLVPVDADADLAPAVHCTPLYRSGDATHALALWLSAAVVERLSPHALARQAVAALPGKFGLLVDDPDRHMQSIAADLHLWVAADQGYCLALGDAADWYCFAHAQDAVEAAVQVALWFASARATITPAPTRLRGLLPYRQPDLPALRAAQRRAAVADGGSPAQALSPGQHAGQGWVMAAPLGRIDAAAMHQLASDLPAHTAIRVTAWRSLLVDAPAMESHIARLDPAHWITQPDDVRLRVSACTGAPRCTQALIPAQAMALALAAQVAENKHLHVSGCAKFCALAADASGVLYASRGAGGEVLLNASAVDQRARPGPPISSLAHTEAPEKIQELLHDLHL
ncbi:nitrite reductase [Acidovorax sp. Be4]|uniref:Nitrite reductase n=1 Tax=Acidovorax bellezanensis TaxID=2976702 RepID=A0ABT2PQM8_9BURK|nr:nitrite reductase [Acidovorax sp. Be4]MCT9812769.1 nitrite reductase [Acidovorax sp. Be4]